MNQFNKDITLNEVLRRQIEVAANQFLQNELTAVLGYEPHTRIDRSKDDVNYRNGTYTRTIDTEYGEINLTIPRDRLNKFQNALFPPYVRRTDGLEEMVIKMGTIPCQVDTYKNENTIFLIRPNRGNIPPRFGHFF